MIFSRTPNSSKMGSYQRGSQHPALRAIRRGARPRDVIPDELVEHTVTPDIKDPVFARLILALRQIDLEIFNEWIDFGIDPLYQQLYGDLRSQTDAFWRTLVEDIDMDRGRNETIFKR
jgi:hypothetical protein